MMVFPSGLRGETMYVARMLGALTACALCTCLIACSQTELRRGVGTASPEPSAVFTPLGDTTLCEVVTTKQLEEVVSLQAAQYSYWHQLDDRGVEYSRFQCEVHGREFGQTGQSTLLISYKPSGYLEAVGSGQFTELDGRGYRSLDLQGLEGRGYVWLGAAAHDVHAAWLYPDNHVLDVRLFNHDAPSRTYKDDMLPEMSELARILVSAVPSVAARPTQEFTSAP